MRKQIISGSAVDPDRGASTARSIVFTFMFGLSYAGTSVEALAASPTGGEPGCLVASAPVQETIFVEASQQDVPNNMNRYIALAAGDAGVNQAIRLVIESVSVPELEYLEGREFWVGPKEALGVLGAARLPFAGFGTFWVAQTLCEPFYDDWHGVCDGGSCADSVCTGGPDAGAACDVDGDCAKDCEAGLRDGVCAPGVDEMVCAGGPNDGSACTSDLDCPGDPCSTHDDCGGGVISVYSAAIVPGLTVSIQVVSAGCDVTEESSFSDAAVMATSQWGDILSSCIQFPCTPPGDGANISDIYGGIQVFVSAPSAPRKARGDVGPSIVDAFIGITDVLTLVTAFQGIPYSLLGAPACDTHVFHCIGDSSYNDIPCQNDADCAANLCPE